jgi:hypothetical protein
MAIVFDNGIRLNVSPEINTDPGEPRYGSLYSLVFSNTAGLSPEPIITDRNGLIGICAEAGGKLSVNSPEIKSYLDDASHNNILNNEVCLDDRYYPFTENDRITDNSIEITQ